MPHDDISSEEAKNTDGPPLQSIPFNTCFTNIPQLTQIVRDLYHAASAFAKQLPQCGLILKVELREEASGESNKQALFSE
eukprot:4405380-Amphidinium_carterae.1